MDTVKPSLKLDWCSAEAARFACEHWHYSGCVPVFKCVRIGVWESGNFVGCVIFSNGAAPQSHCPFGIKRTEICELTRVAMTSHATPVTRVIAIATRMLQKQSEGLRLIVSYADPEQGHHGGIYAGGGWVYLGPTGLVETFEYRDGTRVHTKTIRTGRRGYATSLKASGAIRSVKTWKHKYVMPLDQKMRDRLLPMAKPYPKRAGSADSGTAGVQPVGGGATPTPAL